MPINNGLPIGSASGGENTSPAGTEKLPLSGSKYATLDTIKTWLQTAFALVFAPIAKGVTNGDSHDHSGGDGAQINHTTLSNIGTNTHAQIDTHVASTANPHSTSDANLVTTDVTTNNSSTTKHGFLKKLDNDASHFMNGEGNWVAPSGTSLTVEEADGNPTVTNVTEIIVSNGTLTDNGSGSVTIATGGGGGNAFSTIAVSGQTDVDADSTADTLTLAAGTGITITTTPASDTVTIAASAVGLTNSNITPTTSNVTAAIGTRYFADLSGLTANRNFVLPTCSAGDEIELKITVGDDAFALVIIGATGVSIDGGSTATEWSRLFITGEHLRFVASGSDAWQIVTDGRKPCVGKLSRTSSNANTTHSSATDITPDWNTEEIDVGDICDTSNDRFNIRRAGNYTVAASFAPAVAVTDQKYMIIKVFNGSTQVASGGLRQSMGGAGSAVTLSGVLAPTIACAAGDTLIYKFKTEDANVGLKRTDSGDDQQGATFFAVAENL